MINGTAAKDSSRPSNAEIVILDSDDEDEDEGRVKRELSPTTETLPGPSQSRSVSASQPPSSQASDVIDLTLDSDGEDVLPPRPEIASSSQKRPRANGDSSPTEPIWKKSRIDGPTSSSSVSHPASRDRLMDELAVRTLAPVTHSYPRTHANGHHYPSSSQPATRHGSGSQNYQPDMSFPGLPAPPASLPRRPSIVNHEHAFGMMTTGPNYGGRSHQASGSSGAEHWR